MFNFFEEDVANIIIHNYLQRNAKYHKRYLIDDKLFWVKQLIKGTEHYEEIKRILGGPSRSTVYRWLKEDEEFKVPSNEQLRDITNVEENIKFWFNHLHMEKGECVAIGYDAVAFDLDLVLEEEGIKWGTIDDYALDRPSVDYRNNPSLYERLFNKLKEEGKLVGAAFVVMVLPLSHHKPFICHIYYHKNGSAPENFLNNLQFIRKAISNLGLVYCGDGFDADPQYNQMQNQFFDNWIKHINSKSSCQVHQFFDLNSSNMYNDPSHILKRMRKRFISHDHLVIVPNGAKITVDKFRSLCTEIPDTVFENNNLVSMNDWHPAKIFNAENSLWLLKNMNVDKGEDLAGLTAFILIGTAMNCVLRGKDLTREEQLILCYTGLFGCLWAYAILMINKYNKKNNFIFTKNIVIHSSNYFFGVIGILSSVEDSFSIGRIGSIVLEHYFGRTRKGSKGENTYKRFVNVLNRLQVIDKFKDSQNQRIPYRWFETGIVERGKKTLDSDKCISIMAFMRDIFIKSGFACCRECAFYDIQCDVPSQAEPCDLVITVLEKIALKEIFANTFSVRKSWSLHSSSLSLGRKKGRSTVDRYIDQNTKAVKSQSTKN